MVDGGSGPGRGPSSGATDDRWRTRKVSREREREEVRVNKTAPESEKKAGSQLLKVLPMAIERMRIASVNSPVFETVL